MDIYNWITKNLNPTKLSLTLFGRKFTSLFAEVEGSITTDALKDILLEKGFGLQLSNILQQSVIFHCNGRANILVEELVPLLYKQLDSLLLDSIDPLSLSPSSSVVYMLFGVNGQGKTSSAAKIAYWLSQHNETYSKCVLVAADTFRAGAKEQLYQWSVETKCKFFSKQDTNDPSAVIFEAIKTYQSTENVAFIIDTSGRQENNKSLIQQAQKCYTTLLKALQTFNIENPIIYRLMVLDVHIGNVSSLQLETFDETVGIDGLVLTKLDNHHHIAGKILDLSYKFKKPIFFCSIGEKTEDIQIFNKQHFLDTLLNT